MLFEKTLFGPIDKVATAVGRLRIYEPDEGYYLAFSGGKDSVVIKQLAVLAGVKFDAHYSVTTIDPPELVRFIKDFHPDVRFEYPSKPFLRRLAEKGFPQRTRRWCCAEFKEHGGAGRRVITGVRWAESTKRALRKTVESCYKDKRRTYVNPIIEWSDSDVWEFIKSNKYPYCKLYDEGFKRLGCLFCPMSNRRKYEIERYPRYAKAFIRFFEVRYQDRLIHNPASVARWRSGKEMFDWWIDDKRTSSEPDQMVMFE